MQFSIVQQNLIQHLPTCLQGRWGNLLALIAGALLPLALTPYNLWPLGLVSLLLFALALWQRSARSALGCALSYGIGLYGVGVSWVFVSIYNFGGSSLPLSLALTSIFVVAMAVLFAAPFWLYGRYFSQHPKLRALGFPLIWSLSEWLRTWLFTGFPWLFAGYSFTDHGLNGWAPVLGVNGLGLLASLLVSLVALAIYHPRASKIRWLALSCALFLFGSNSLLQQQQWTTANGSPIQVAIVQPNIAQELKWQPWFLAPTLERLSDMSEPLWDNNDWVIWPEAAVPQIYHEARPYLTRMRERALNSNSALVTGILTLDPNSGRYHNSIIATGNGYGMYHKQRLVPFGEYVPWEKQLRGLIAFFNLPTSIISAGGSGQAPLQLGKVSLAPFICYEVVYPDLVAKQAKNADVLITVSNDAWFGDSIGPLQHLEMARMRALETGRYMIRGTNTGVSAIINPTGQISATTPRLSQTSFSGSVEPRTGNTPYMTLGYLPLYLSWLLLIAARQRVIRTQHN